MSSLVAQTVLARQVLLLLVVLSAAFSVYFASQASSESYFNRLFSSDDPGCGISIRGTVDQIISGAQSKTGQQLEVVRLKYTLSSALPPFDEQILVDKSVGRTLYAGGTVKLRVWSDSPASVRVDVPCETARYDRIAVHHAIAASLTLAACIFCGWCWSKVSRSSKV